MSPRIIVVPPSAETGEIARALAPSGYELVLVRGDGAELSAALAGYTPLRRRPAPPSGEARLSFALSARAAMTAAPTSRCSCFPIHPADRRVPLDWMQSRAPHALRRREKAVAFFVELVDLDV